MSQLEEFLPENATSEKLYEAMAWPRRTIDATKIQGFGLTRELARKVRHYVHPPLK
jgi:hypothetical protein